MNINVNRLTIFSHSNQTIDAMLAQQMILDLAFSNQENESYPSQSALTESLNEVLEKHIIPYPLEQGYLLCESGIDENNENKSSTNQLFDKDKVAVLLPQIKDNLSQIKSILGSHIDIENPHLVNLDLSNDVISTGGGTVAKTIQKDIYLCHKYLLPAHYFVYDVEKFIKNLSTSEANNIDDHAIFVFQQWDKMQADLQSKVLELIVQLMEVTEWRFIIKTNSIDTYLFIQHNPFLNAFNLFPNMAINYFEQGKQVLNEENHSNIINMKEKLGKSYIETLKSALP